MCNDCFHHTFRRGWPGAAPVTGVARKFSLFDVPASNLIRYTKQVIIFEENL